MKMISGKSLYKFANNKLLVFSCILFLIIALSAVIAYSISARQINRTFINQQLSITSETMRLRLATAVDSELSLVMKMADTPVIMRYFQNPSDLSLKSQADAEIAIYKKHFNNKILYWVNDTDKIFYSTRNDPYVVNPDEPKNYWYNLTLYETEKYIFNINYNPDLNQIYLWVNVPVFINTETGKKPIGLIGTGINLVDFSNFVLSNYHEFDEHITIYMFNKYNEITSAEDYDLVRNKIRLDEHLGDTGKELIKATYDLSGEESGSFIYNKKIYLINSIPAMEWYLAVSYPAPGLLSLNHAMNTVFFSMLFLILFLFIVINAFIARSENAIEKQNLKLLEANKKAESASRAKSDFLARMSHEIRTPMNAITGMAELLLRGELSCEARGYARDIKQAGNNLVSIINDILDLSKIEAGKLEIVPAKYMLSSLINDTVNIIRTKLKEKPIRFFTNIDGNIPNSLIGDETRLRQILLNLLSNAVKYTDKGHIGLTITMDKQDAGQVLLRIDVADTGKGIKPEHKASLFEEFVRVDMKKNQGIEGTGLGLAITNRLCKAMNGKLSMESEYGKGSVFTVVVPQDIGSKEPFAVVEEPEKKKVLVYENSGSSGVIRNTFPNARFLIVDDISTNLKVAEGLLSPYNAKIDTCLSGAEAIELVKRNRYDLIFMDHMMPEMDGIEATAAIRKLETKNAVPENNGKQIPIIALTANAVVGMKEMFIEKGFNDFISKPIDVSKLDEIVDRWLTKEKKSMNNTESVITKENDEVSDKDTGYLLPVIPNVDTVKGVAMLRGRIDVYERVLSMFCEDADKRLPQLQIMPKMETMLDFIVQVHSLKSASASIGAQEVSSLAAGLEAAGKTGDVVFIRENLPGFTVQLADLVRNIRAALS